MTGGVCPEAVLDRGGLCRGCAYHYASQDAVHHMVSVKMLCMTGGLSRGCA